VDVVLTGYFPNWSLARVDPVHQISRLIIIIMTKLRNNLEVESKIYAFTRIQYMIIMRNVKVMIIFKSIY
jgi:hypothetical protein